MQNIKYIFTNGVKPNRGIAVIERCRNPSLFFKPKYVPSNYVTRFRAAVSVLVGPCCPARL